MSRPILALIAVAALLASSSAMAHARLESSSPAANATLKSAPAQMTLTFSEEGEMGPIKMTRDGKEVPIALDWSGTARKSFLLKLPPLAPGAYTVEWSMMSTDDGHVTRGSFGFSITG
jgi:methionine-rich copper-binding protein CopC